MSSIFSSLHMGLTGLNAAQTQITTTGHNITNADSDHYTRQRVVQSAREAFHDIPGDLGTGTQVDTVVRVYDEFTFDRLRASETNLQSSTYKKTILEEITKRFPDLNSVGIGRDVQNYFNAWNNFAANPTEGSQKINVLNNAAALAKDINNTSKMLDKMQQDVNSQIQASVDEINKYAKEIAAINKQIMRIESVGNTRANDLRDKRDQLELALSKITNLNVFKGDAKGYSTVDPTITDMGTKYNLNISGFNIIDGGEYHPLVLDKSENKYNFYGIYFEREDGNRTDMAGKITGGKLGAALDLRGRHMSATGEFQDGIIQKYKDQLDVFAKGLITETNNVYAKSSLPTLNSDELNLKPTQSLMNYDNYVRHGSFDVVVYNNQGQEVARKTININGSTSMDNRASGNSIVDDFNSDTDDNGDKNSLNDVDDYFKAYYHYDPESGKGVFGVTPKKPSGGYSVAFVDKGSNFPGVIGVNRFFEGNGAKDISVRSELTANPHLLKAYSNPTPGNNDVANDMVQLQYKKINFYSNKFSDKIETVEGYYRFMTSDLASETQTNNDMHETYTAINKVAVTEHQSVSGVNMNEELTSLIRYQSSYGAAAKIITTVEKMLDTLLTLKQ